MALRQVVRLFGSVHHVRQTPAGSRILQRCSLQNSESLIRPRVLVQRRFAATSSSTSENLDLSVDQSTGNSIKC